MNTQSRREGVFTLPPLKQEKAHTAKAERGHVPKKKVRIQKKKK